MSDLTAPFTLEQLDFFGTLETLSHSLDDAYWVSGSAVVKDTSGAISVSTTATAEVSTDISAPFTLEQLDAFGTLETLSHSLDDSYWVSGSARIRLVTGSAAASTTGTATGLIEKIVTASASVAATASGAANRIRKASGSASVTTTSTLSAFRERLQTASATATFSATATGVFELLTSGVAAVTSSATGLAKAIFQSSGSAGGAFTTTITARVRGSEWTDTTPGSETWTVVTPGSESWTEISAGNETWEDAA